MSEDPRESRLPVIALGVVALVGIAAFVVWPLFAHKDETAKTDGVPDGTPQELVKFIESEVNHLRRSRLSTAGREKSLRKIVIAADKALAGDPKDEEILMKAYEAKAAALRGLAQSGDDDAAARLSKFLKSLERNDTPAVHEFLLIQKAVGESGSDAAIRQAVIAKAVAYMQAGNVEKLSRVAASLGRVFEDRGFKNSAAELYSQTAISLKGSTTKRGKTLARVYDGYARRNRLVSSKLTVLSGKTIDGKPVEWKDYKGKVVLIDFWATWCGPCIAEIPNVKRAYHKYHDRGFEVIGVSIDRNPEDVRAFLKKVYLPWTSIVHNDPSESHPMQYYYGVTGIPFTILVDRDGTVVATGLQGDELQKQLSRLFESENKVAPNPPSGGD